ncbi:hypothetical protein HAX54_006172, partial [Datura stramonium]|nr:hypothetical protein [Datura stramonium]
MASKGKDVVVVEPSLKRNRKGKKGASSSASKAGPLRRFWSKSGRASWAYLVQHSKRSQ